MFVYTVLSSPPDIEKAMNECARSGYRFVTLSQEYTGNGVRTLVVMEKEVE